MTTADARALLTAHTVCTDPAATIPTRKVKPGSFTIHDLDYAGPAGEPPDMVYAWPQLLRNIKVKGIEVHFSPAKEMAFDLGICYDCLKPGTKFAGSCSCVRAAPRSAAGPSRSQGKKKADADVIAAAKAKRQAMNP